MVLKWPEIADAGPENCKNLVVEPFLRFLISRAGFSNDIQDVTSNPESMRIMSGLENMLDYLEPLLVVSKSVAGAEEIIDLLISELIIDDFVENKLVSIFGKLNPTRIFKQLLEIFVEIFQLLLIHDKFLLSKKERVDGRMESLLEEKEGRGCVFAVITTGLLVKFGERLDNLLLGQVLDDVFDTINEDGAFGFLVLIFADGPDVAFVVADVDGDILPE